MIRNGAHGSRARSQRPAPSPRPRTSTWIRRISGRSSTQCRRISRPRRRATSRRVARRSSTPSRARSYVPAACSTCRLRHSTGCWKRRRSDAEHHRADPGALRVGARSGEEHPPARRPSAYRVRDCDRPSGGNLRARRLLDRQHRDRRRRAAVRRGGALPASGRVRHGDLARHRVDHVHARAARGSLRPVCDRASDESVSRRGRVSARARATARDAGSGFDSRRRAREAASREDVGRRGPDNAAAARPVASRRRVARRPVPSAAGGARAEQRARDRVVAGRLRHGHARRANCRAVLHGGLRRLQCRRRGGLGARAVAREGGRRLAAARRASAAPVFSARMKVARLETLFCDAGWRPWIFLKATTDDGAVGWAEITDSHGSPRGLAGIVEDLAPLVVGRAPGAVEAIYWDLYRATRQSPGGVIQKAIGGIENALLDLKAKSLGVSVHELFGGPTRDSVDVYWSHCGTTRARAWEVTRTPKLASYADVTALGREFVERGFRAYKTNIVIPGDEPRVLMPGFGGSGLDRNPSRELEDELRRLLDAFDKGTQGEAQPILDLNFNLTAEGVLRVARALEDFELVWLEVDSFDAESLASLRHGITVPVCSGENLYTNRAFRPFFEAGAGGSPGVGVIWEGFPP